MKDRAQAYQHLRKTIRALTEGETDPISLMATISCELFHGMDGFDWVGFYRNVGDRTLKVGPYQGGHGCLVIPFDRGVCGACASSGETVIVDDVEAFPGHIACSSSTRSEIVLPVRDWEGELIGVLDVDSDQPAHFGPLDEKELGEMLAEVFG